MSGSHSDMPTAQSGETQPLLPEGEIQRSSISTPHGEKTATLSPLSLETIGRLWVAAGAIFLVVMWCVMDSWNRDLGEQIQFQARVHAQAHQNGAAATAAVSYVLTLAFIQYLFLAAVFLGIPFCAAILFPKQYLQSLRSVANADLRDSRWSALVVSHILSTFLLQSLMMPRQLMSLATFSATRSAEVPAAAAARTVAFKERFGGHSPRTIGLMFAATFIMFFSYTRISECLCVWSGSGVALTGLSFFAIYFLLLAAPAVNTVCQEVVMTQMEVNPLCMLGIQNAFASLVFLPLLLLSGLMGYEDALKAGHFLFHKQETALLVLWLCVQTAITSLVTVGLICLSDSFWAIAARSFRVVLWWAQELFLFYMSGSTLLSVARPDASWWSFVMLFGVLLAAGSLMNDKKEVELDAGTKEEKTPLYGKLV